MVDKYSNDMELGARVRWYIKWLYESITNKDEEHRQLLHEEYKDDNKWSV